MSIFEYDSDVYSQSTALIPSDLNHTNRYGVNGGTCCSRCYLSIAFYAVEPPTNVKLSSP
jgi:hypothetical protein